MTSLFFPFESPGRQTIDWDLLGYVVLCVCLRACVWVCVCLYLPPLDPEMYAGSITASVVSRRLIALRTAPIRDRRCVTEPLSCLWPTRKIPGKIRRNQSQFKSDWSVLLERTVSDFISGIFLSFFSSTESEKIRWLSGVNDWLPVGIYPLTSPLPLHSPAQIRLYLLPAFS